MKWVEALKAYAQKKGKYVVPKKGTPEYDEVRAMMDGAKPKADAKVEAKVEVEDVMKPKRAKTDVKKLKEKMEKVKADKVAKGEALKSEQKAKVKEAVHDKVLKRVASKKVVELKTSSALEAKPAIKKARAMRKAGSVSAGMIPEGVTKEAVADSRNPSAILASATNAHLPVVAREDVPGLRLPRLAPLKETQLPMLLEKDKLVDKAPFSFQNLKNRLGA